LHGGVSVLPDPFDFAAFTDDFGPRLLPQPGFLSLPPEEVPTGFQEISHHYAKKEYRIHFQKMTDERCNLHIVESPTARYLHTLSDLVREFDYRGITGHVYAEAEPEKLTLHLIWLNPPMQRVSIHLSQRLSDGYSPDDLIKILQGMKQVTC
jgi:hypothetical protein